MNASLAPGLFTPRFALALAAAVAAATGARAHDGGFGPERACTILNPPDPSRGIYIAERWPGGIVPFDFDPSVTAQNRQRVLDAMETIEAVCDADFVPRTVEADYVRIFNSTANSAWVGKRGGEQYVNIWTWESHYTIVHELMHTLGAWHEHQRSDRDNYVTINYDNVGSDPFERRQFDIVATGTTFGWYDFDSVMHYPRFARSTNGHATIEPRAGHKRWTSMLGQGTHLSTGDIWLLTELYGGPRPPGAFDLVSPASGSAVGPAWTPAFSWSAAPLADSYRLLVDDDPAFATPAIDETLAGTSFAGGSLADNRLYYWTVRAANAAGSTRPWHMPVAVLYSGTAVPAVVHVDDSAPPGGDGASWSAPLADLQDALALASCANAVEIRIGGGRYTPDRGTGDRHASFMPRSGMALRGGYAGYGSTNPDTRDPDAHPSILSGDLAGNDSPNFQNYAENSRHVIRIAGQRTDPVILDGLTVASGNADGAAWPDTGAGAGLWTDDSHVQLIDCAVTLCAATRDGGGAYFQSSDVLIRACRFLRNRTSSTYGGSGGGFSADFGWRNVVIDRSIIEENQAAGAGGSLHRCCTVMASDSMWLRNTALTRPGGGLWVVTGASTTATNCIFQGNTAAASAGGGAAVAFTSNAAFRNCLFANNVRSSASASPGGGLWVGDGVGGPANATLVNCTFSQNSSPGGAGGGAIGVTQTSSLVGSGCILWGNWPTETARTGSATISLTFSNVQGGAPGIGNINADPRFPDRGGFQLSHFSPCIDAGNNAALPADVTTDLAGSARFRNDHWTPDTGAPDPARPTLPIVDMGAYEFQRSSCPADFNGDGQIDFFDYLDFVQAFADEDPSADFNRDGQIDFFDYLDFVQAFAEGCE